MSTETSHTEIPSLYARLRIRVLGWLGARFLNTLSRTLRWQYLGEAANPAFWRTGTTPRIVAFWHDQQLVMPWVYRRPGLELGLSIWVLRSQHSDGQLIAEILSYCGAKTVGGSSSRGGTRALVALNAKLSEGDAVAITPDGPRGPRHEVKPGALKLAQLSGVPIYPLALAARKRWTVRSWDRMTIPKPFSAITLAIGEPFTVPRKCEPAEFEQYVQLLGQRLEQLTAQVESHVAGAAPAQGVRDAGAL